MRRFVIALLLAGAAASPALADDNGRGHHDRQQQQQQQQQQQPQQQRGDRGQAHEQRQQGDNQGRSERFNGGNFVRQQPMQQGDARGFDRSRFERVNQAPQQVVPQQQAYDRNRGGRSGFSGGPEVVEQQQNGSWTRNRSNWNRGFNGQQAQQSEQSRQRWNGERGTWNRQGQVYQQQAQNRSRWANGGNWNRDWRNDRRYDWRRYRDSHRSLFHIGVYFDPFGYGYRPFDIGYQLGPDYYGQQYWIDPAMYELPYPPPGTQWVRYWNDAVLVDMYSGEVVDVIHDFFW